jgi:putative ABC transport system permease protein
MTAAVLVRLSFRSILRNRLRSLLTTLGIIIGVCSVIVMVAIGEGSQAVIQENIASMGTNLIMVMPPRGPGTVNRLTLDDAARLRRDASLLTAVSGVVRAASQVVGGNGNWSTSVFGVEPDYLEIKKWSLKSGAFFTEREVKGQQKVAVLGTTVATQLFGEADPIGEKIRIGATPFQVVGLLESKGKTGMGNDQDDVVMVPITSALGRLRRSNYLSSIETSAVNEKDMDRAQTEIEALLREGHRIRDDQDSDFNIFNQAQIIEMASSTARTLTVLLGAIAGVSLLVGGIGIMNIMLVSVTERTREIGIRLSVGARRRDILLQFLTEAVVLSLLGGLIGIMVALGGVYLVSRLGSLRTVINPFFIFLSVGFAAAVGVFFGYYPARKAAEMNPIDALRTE